MHSIEIPVLHTEEGRVGGSPLSSNECAQGGLQLLCCFLFTILCLLAQTVGEGERGGPDALGLLSSYSSDTPRSQDTTERLGSDPSQSLPHQSSAKATAETAAEEVDNMQLCSEPAAEISEAQSQPSPETAAVMEKLLAFVKVGFSSQWCRLLVAMPNGLASR